MAARLKYCTAVSASTGRRCRRPPVPGERQCATHLKQADSEQVEAGTDDVEAYSSNTNKHYPNWAALLEAEASGYVIVGKLDVPNDAFRVAVVGPFTTKAEADTARPRYYQRWKKEVFPHKVRTSVRICWKDR